MAETLVLRDTQGRQMLCEVHRRVELEGVTYILLTPTLPVAEILVWKDEEVELDAKDFLMGFTEDDYEGTLDEPDWEDMEKILPTARAVLAEQNLNLQTLIFDQVHFLSVEGDIPLPSDEDLLEISTTDDEDELERYQLLATFYHEDRHYGVFVPPADEDGNRDSPVLLAVQPQAGEPYPLFDFPPDLMERLQILLSDDDEDE